MAITSAEYRLKKITKTLRESFGISIDLNNDMKTITEAAHNAGANCGFDLAHAMGNIPMQLHDWKSSRFHQLNCQLNWFCFLHRRHQHPLSMQQMALDLLSNSMSPYYHTQQHL